MSKEDYHTRTVDGARAWAERHAEPECDDRPTNAELEADELRMEDRAKAMDAVRDALEDLSEVDPEAADEIFNLVDSLDCGYHKR